MAFIEPILRENKDRFVIFPIKHHDIWDWYKKIEANFWIAQPIDLQRDISNWNNNLKEDERLFIKNILAFFAVSGKMRKEIPAKSFSAEVQYPEAKAFYDFQIMQENIHSQSLSQLFDSFVKEEKEKFFVNISGNLSILKKIDSAKSYLGANSFAEKLVAFAAMEILFFAGSFCSLSRLAKKELMPGLNSAINSISRDKKLYADFGVHLHNHHLENKVPKKRINEIILEAFKIEKEFLNEFLPESISSEKMEHYLEFVADNLLLELGCEPEFGTSNPFDYTGSKENANQAGLFEKRVDELQRNIKKGRFN